jgi:hypothetical protein
MNCHCFLEFDYTLSILISLLFDTILLQDVVLLPELPLWSMAATVDEREWRQRLTSYDNYVFLKVPDIQETLPYHTALPSLDLDSTRTTARLEPMGHLDLPLLASTETPASSPALWSSTRRHQWKAVMDPFHRIVDITRDCKPRIPDSKLDLEIRAQLNRPPPGFTVTSGLSSATPPLDPPRQMVTPVATGQKAQGRFEQRPAPTCQFPCEFADYSRCDTTFDLDDRDAWVEHITIVHLQDQLPSKFLCWFCDDINFHAEDRGFDSDLRMHHIHDHIRNAGRRRVPQPTYGWKPDWKPDLKFRGRLFLLDSPISRTLHQPVTPMAAGRKGTGHFDQVLAPTYSWIISWKLFWMPELDLMDCFSSLVSLMSNSLMSNLLHRLMTPVGVTRGKGTGHLEQWRAPTDSPDANAASSPSFNDCYYKTSWLPYFHWDNNPWHSDWLPTLLDDGQCQPWASKQQAYGIWDECNFSNGTMRAVQYGVSFLINSICRKPLFDWRCPK